MPSFSKPRIWSRQFAWVDNLQLRSAWPIGKTTFKGQQRQRRRRWKQNFRGKRSLYIVVVVVAFVVEKQICFGCNLESKFNQLTILVADKAKSK